MQIFVKNILKCTYGYGIMAANKNRFTKLKEKKMLSELRQQEIINLLESHGSVKTSALCEKFSISRETIRRDLESLEERNLVRRIHGGAMKVEHAAYDTPFYSAFDQRMQAHCQKKQLVAWEAAEYIEDGKAIALDSGTTALELARALKTKKFCSLTVVTNSFPVASELTDIEGITLVMTGGIYRPEERAFASDLATLIFSKINIDILFLTTCGVSVERGITYQRIDEVVVQNKMMEASEKTIIIADSSKIGSNSVIKMCGIEKVSMIITDSEADPEQIEHLRTAGIPVVIAEERRENLHEL